MLRPRQTKRQFAQPRQRQRVDDEGRVQRYSVSQTKLRILRQETEYRPDLDRKRRSRSGFAARAFDSSGEKSELVRPSRVVLADDLTTEIGLQTGYDVLAGRVIGRNQVGGLDALLVHVFADKAWGTSVALPGRREEPWRAEPRPRFVTVPRLH